MIGLFLLFISPFVNGDRIVETNIGPIRGTSLDEKNVVAFLGIPFAEPPVGNLRFAKPVPKSPWTETFDATELPPACLQPGRELTSKHLNESFEMDEDCLYLNLWVPECETTLKPVMIYIYGGGYKSGSSSFKIYNGASLSGHGDVIVASMNYRLAMLGFFSAFIDEAPGNMGLYDQLLAIQWIKDNAMLFGGNPDNIVLFGESSGAFSVSLHMVSPLSKNLFKRAILQSASAISPMFSDDNKGLRTGSQMISKLVGCATENEELVENPKRVIECMRRLPPNTFAEADPVLYQKLEMLIPRIGDEFLPMDPVDLFRKGEFKDTEVLFGVTRDEGLLYVAFQIGIKSGDIFGETIGVNDLNETSAKEMIHNRLTNEDDEQIIQNYFKRVTEENRYTYLHAVGDIIGDSLITCPTVFQADFQSLKTHPVYFYVFDYKSPLSPYPDWAGVPHFEEIQYVLGNPFLKSEFSDYEEKLSKDMMNMWVAFAKTGNPTIPGGLQWPKYSYEDPQYVSISMRDKLGVKPDNFRCEAWRNSYKSTIDDDVIRNIENSNRNNVQRRPVSVKRTGKRIYFH